MQLRTRAAGKWLVSGPPLVYLLLFFAIPALIMVLASFRTPGEFGGLAPLVDEDGEVRSQRRELCAVLRRTSLYAQIFVKSFWLRTGDDADLPGARVSAARR